MSTKGLDALQLQVWRDPDLARRLRAMEPGGFIDEVVRIAPRLGCDVERADVEAAIAQGRQDWMLRWIR